MRLVWAEDERVAGHHFGLAIFVANNAFSGNHQIQFPLGRVRVVREVALCCWHPAPFQIKRVPLGKVKRSRFASQRFRNSFKGDGVFSAWRLPRVLFDFVEVNFFHAVKSPRRSRFILRHRSNPLQSLSRSVLRILRSPPPTCHCPGNNRNLLLLRRCADCRR